MLLDITQEDRQLWVSYFNLDGKTRFKTYDLKPEDMFNWEVCDEGDPNADSKMKNWDGRSVKKARSRFLNKYRIIEYMDQISPSDRKLIFGYHFPRTYFVDIEVEVTDSFPEPSKAPNPVTTICIVTPEKQCIVLATKDLDNKTQSKIQKQIDEHFKDIDDDFSFTFKCFKTEYDMMSTFMMSFVQKFPMMTGWNYIKFDWQYIINRCKKLGIDIGSASPIGRNFGRDEFPCHVGVMDYLDIYAKWDRTVDIKEDFKLDTVGEAVVGIKKVKYEGTIQDMYEKDYPKYVFYNVIDTALVYLIHQKIKTMDIALTIAHMTQISIFKAASPVAITEALLAREFLTRNLVMAKDPKAPPSKREQFEGAFVKEPITGMHNAVAAFDFASLYPSIMRQLNVSPESFKKKVSPEKREAERGESNIVSVTGAVYDTKRSILKDVLTRLYDQRKEYKKESFRLQQKAYDLEQELKKDLNK
jgi:DNA polymerase elongation subunit (family B)